ncbi:MAG: hypothetical protein R3281_07805 [Balneolaceae bacterium]|nr:hypothetical protein [Balneolaceae bacterium]
MPDTVEITPGEVSISELREEVREQIGNPVSSRAVAATLESFGLRDVDVREQFESDSVFELAERLYDDIKEELKRENGNRNQEHLPGKRLRKPALKESAKLFGKHYSLGLLFSLPMISQIAAVILFRYSLWAWLEFNEAQATMVAFGTIAAFIITGGFVQTLGRHVSKYKGEENLQLAFKASRQIMTKGVITVLLVTFGLYLLNIVIPFYPMGMMLIGLAYLLLISLLLLASGVLYAMEHRMMILAAILVGTGVVIAGMDLLHIGIYLSQWIGMSVSIVILLGYAVLYYRLQIRFSGQEQQEQSLPDPEIRYYNSYRYFTYGFCYFLFLFLDRILAWSAGPPPPPYIIWFNTPYELGMDWALISLVLTIAVLEYSIHSFSKQMLPVQKRAPFLQIDLFNDYFKSFYLKQVVLLLVVGVCSIGITYYSINSLRVFIEDVPEIRDFFANPMTPRVFWIASISYLFLVYGLLNSLFFFTLNRSSFVMYPMILATVVNFFVGYVCSRAISLEYAAMGLLAGSLTFAVVTGWLARTFFKRLDYYYYSAF